MQLCSQSVALPHHGLVQLADYGADCKDKTSAWWVQGLLGSMLAQGGGPSTSLAFVEAESPARQLAYTPQSQVHAVSN